MKFNFATPGQRQMWVDTISNLEISILPDEYKVDNWGEDTTEDDEILTSDELGEFDLDSDEIEENNGYKFDPNLKTISFDCDGYTVTGLYNVEYEDLFYKIWIERNGSEVYSNNYGHEVHDNNQISDDQVETYIDKLIEYAMESDSTLHESFHFEEIEEEIEIVEDFNNIKTLKSSKGDITIKFKNGDSFDIGSDEAKVISKFYDQLPDEKKKQYADLLNKSNTSFLIAYKNAMKG